MSTGNRVSHQWNYRLTVSVHALRHAFATTCYRATGDILAVSRLLGHSSVATTMRYIQQREGAMAQAPPQIEG